MTLTTSSGLAIPTDYKKEYRVSLYNGDCLDFLRTIPKAEAQLIVTSPPYNIGKPYEKRLEMNEYLRQQSEVIKECVRVLEPRGNLCWEVGNYVTDHEIIPLDVLLYPYFKKLNLKLRNRIIWHFGHGLHSSNRFSGRYETINWFTKSDDHVFNLDMVRVPQKYPSKRYYKGAKKGLLSGHPLGKNPTDVWEIPNVKSNHPEKTTHPCQFPVELVERLVLALSNEDALVLDPFMGVGSTAVAALLHNRRATGAEISKEYVEIARNRIRQAIQGKLKTRPMGKPIYEPSLKEEKYRRELGRKIIHKELTEFA